MFSALYGEHYIVDDEDTGVSVGRESEWYLSLYPDGRAILPFCKDGDICPLSGKADSGRRVLGKIMRNDVRVRLAIGLIAFCLFAAGAAAVNARQLSNAVESRASNVKSGVYSTVESSSFDDFEFSPCERFPKAYVFDSFEKAFLSPEKVKCLNPTFAGDDLNMKRLPSRLGTLVNLEVLSFGCLEALEALPEEIGNLRKLEELIIDNGNGCSMSVSLPRSIGKLENLRVLRLYGAIERGERRKIESLPGTIANLRRLEVLDLGRNGLEAVPPQIAALSNLKTLRLEYNSLRAIPAFIGDFKNLKELSLDANENIANLPASLLKLKGLRISMGNNSLKLKDQKSLRSRFPRLVFSFENEFDDSRANEEPPKSRTKSRTKRKR